MSSSPSSLIQRLVIAHFKLYQDSTGKSFDEETSDAEILEQVLYFSDSEDLLSYLNVCSVLYTLPSAFGIKEDRSRLIQLQKSTLLFVELEADIVALVELRTVNENNDHEQQNIVATIQRSLHDSHLLFRLLRKGGILLRLKDHDQMQHLFDLRKQLRQQTDRTTQDEIETLYENLCITSLRRELRIHYDAFLLEVDSSLLMDEDQRTLPRTTSSTHLLNDAVLEHLEQIPESLLSLDAMAIFCYRNDYSGLMTYSAKQAFSVPEASMILNYMLTTGTKSHPPAEPRSFMGRNLLEKVSIPNGFMNPPLLSVLSALDEPNAFESEDGNCVWLPPVYPTCSDEGETVVEARACLYKHGFWNVLLYLPTDIEYRSLLSQAQEFLVSSFQLIDANS